LILALLENKESFACGVLHKLGCNLDNLAATIENNLSRNDKLVSDACLRLTRGVERVLRGAMLEANGLDQDSSDKDLEAFFRSANQACDHPIPDSYHLLLGLLYDRESQVAKLLQDRGIDYVVAKQN
jgi:ATP-dependent Clp protease ATP-binding subunit ClpA